MKPQAGYLRKLTRFGFGLIAIAALTLPTTASAVYHADQATAAPKYRVLIVTAGNKKDGVTDAGVNAIKAIGKDTGTSGKFSTFVAGNPEQITDQFTETNLARYRAIIFLGTGANALLSDAQKAAFESYFHNGGGFFGIGSAIETEPDWQFYSDILGTRSSGKTDVQSATIKVADRVHDATKNLPEYWNRADVWYNFAANVRGVSHVLATVVEDPFGPQPQGQVLDGIAGGTMGADHPVVWCKDYKGGRSFYTAGGNTPSSFDEAVFRSHLEGAIDWTAGVANAVYSDCGATVLANYQQSFVAAPPNLSEPIGFDVLNDGTGRVIQTDRRGGVRLHDPATNSTTLLATVPVYTNSEDGLYGPEVDNDFTTNKWVYLYYSPPTVKDVKLSDGSIVTQTTPFVNDPLTPINETNAPTIASSLSAWDPYIGYFQLSRFKFVEATPSTPAHLDLATEQEIMRVPVNRGACCHVAGDIDFDSHNNLWLVTGDDTPAGGGNSGGFGPFNGQLTNEMQTVTVTGATGGTFTLTFDGQTTAPIPFPLVNTNIEAALEALSNLDDVGVAGNAATNRNVNFGGVKSAQDVPMMTADASGLTGSAPAASVTQATVAGGQGVNIPALAGQQWTPHVDARRSALNTNDLRGKVLRIKVKDGDISPAEANDLGGAYTVPAGNLYPAGTAKTRPEVYAMGFRNPFRITLDKDDVAYVSDYSPDSQTPANFRGPAGTGRFEIVREPANYGWPLCYKTDLGYYKWDFETGAPLPLGAPEHHDCDNPSRGPENASRWVASGGPTVEPGLEFGPPITNPEIWYSYRDNQGPPNGPQGTPCFAGYNGSWNGILPPAPGGTPSPCPRVFPELFTGGVGPHGTAPYNYDPVNPNPTKFPPYWDGAFMIGEFTQDTMREVRLDSQNRVFKINNALPCGAAPVNPLTRPFLCDNPMDMEFGRDGTFYLLTYGDGFFAINPDAAMERFEYVKGLRPPLVSISATPTSGPAPLTVAFTSTASDPDPGDSIRYEWDFDGNGSVDSIDPNASYTYTVTGQYVAKLTVFDSSGKSTGANTTITVGNTAPTVTVSVPPAGGLFAFGDNIPFTVTVTDPEDGAINCSLVTVTFVLGHDTHGHAQASSNGCSGVLPTDAGDVSHGGILTGVISASYTDGGGSGGVPALTTVGQSQIRLKHQEVELVLNQSGTNTAGNNDGGPGAPPSPGTHRGSLSAGDWIQLNGPFNLLNIDSVTFRVADAGAGRTAGSPLAAIEVHQDAVDGPIVQTFNLVSTGDPAVWSSQTFPISLAGTHELFLVFRTVTDGATGNNLFNLNWAEFGGSGIGQP